MTEGVFKKNRGLEFIQTYFIIRNDDTKTAFSVPIFDKTNIKIKNNKSFKRFAFTLAETLITLTIIGVVAALTVPNLLNKYTKHTYVVGLKKAYSQLQNAVKMIPITEGCSAGDYDCAPLNIENLSKQFKLAYYCKTQNGCNFDMSKFTNDSDHEGFETVDGLQFVYGVSSFGVDINGNKGPNIWGRDIFFFDIDANGQKGLILPEGSKNSYCGYWRNNNRCTTQSVNNKQFGGIGSSCTGRVLEEDAMNY